MLSSKTVFHWWRYRFSNRVKSPRRSQFFIQASKRAVTSQSKVNASAEQAHNLAVRDLQKIKRNYFLERRIFM